MMIVTDTSPLFIRERVIVTDTRRNIEAIIVANFSFISETKSNIGYLMVEIREMEKNLQDAR